MRSFENKCPFHTTSLRHAKLSSITNHVLSDEKNKLYTDFCCIYYELIVFWFRLFFIVQIEAFVSSTDTDKAIDILFISIVKPNDWNLYLRKSPSFCVLIYLNVLFFTF